MKTTTNPRYKAKIVNGLIFQGFDTKEKYVFN